MQSLIPSSIRPGPPAVATADAAARRTVYIVDDEDLIRGSLASLLRSMGLEVRDFPTTAAFLAAPKGTGPGAWCWTCACAARAAWPSSSRWRAAGSGRCR